MNIFITRYVYTKQNINTHEQNSFIIEQIISIHKTNTYKPGVIIVTWRTNYFMHKTNYLNSSNKKIYALEQIIWTERINNALGTNTSA